MSKSTPGPWSIPHFARDNVDCDCTYVLAEPWFGSICDVSIDNGLKIGEGGNDSPKLEEAKANAHLISAAPDLLEALEECERVLSDLSSTNIEGTRTRKAFEKARAAIKKAKGQS